MKQFYYVIQTLLRGRGSNIIKVVSLALGLTMSILLIARVAYEQSFDKCYKEYDNLYQILSVFTVNGEKMPPQVQNCGPVAGGILESFPELVESATSTCEWAASDPLFLGSVRFNDSKVMADSLFFQTMGVEVLSGNPVKELQQADVIFLSDRFARKIFGDENPIGKQVNYNHRYNLTVKGTYQTIAENSTMHPEAVISLPTMLTRGIGNYSWGGGDSYPEYIRFRSGVDKSILNARIDAMIEKYLPAKEENGFGYTAFVQPIRDTYRNNSDVKMMTTVMAILALAILFIATLNYVLISISSLSYRAKGVGVHKCNGAGDGRIFGMFLLETGIIILASLLLMALILLNFRDFFEDTAGAKLSLLFDPKRIWVPIAVVTFLFFVGGVLPGRLFSRIPVSQLFHHYTEGKKSWKLPLLFIQFAGVAFICGLMCVVMAQYHYVLNKDMGYNPQRIALANGSFDGEESCDAAYQFFKGLPYVESLASALSTPIYGYSGAMIQSESGQALFSTRFSNVHPDFLPLMGITLKAGRMPQEPTEVLINETFARMMQWGNTVVGRHFLFEGNSLKVGGVLNEFQISDFTSEKMPFVTGLDKQFHSTLHLRLKEPFADNLRLLNKAATEAFPDKTIDFVSYEKEIVDRYNSVRVFRNATLMAAITMFFVMLMGLIGYTTDEVRRRSKEIAIRKVNGAEASSILRLLSRDVLCVAAPAVVIGIGVSWYINDLWMDLFAERVFVSPLAYLLVVIAILALVVGCVLWKSWSIANENPVNSIKSE